jgi:hypothetical protein
MDAEQTSAWRFAQCFGDKGDVEDITEGGQLARKLLCVQLTLCSRYHFDSGI